MEPHEIRRKVAYKVGTSLGKRKEANRVHSSCEILYMTAGLLMEILLHAPQTLNTFSHVVLDEVHERTISAEFLAFVIKMHM